MSKEKEEQNQSDEVNSAVCEIVTSAMRDFREGMEHKIELSTRIGRRTTQIIR